MDYQKFVNGYKPMTCILSVEKTPDGKCGTIRMEAGNPAYISSIEDPSHISSSEMLSNKFVPGSEYTRYIPKDLTFEDLCFSAAVLGKPIHTYSRPERYPFWLNVFIMPLESDDPNISYCAYTLELQMTADAELQANLSADAMSDVLSACIKMRGTGERKEVFKEVVEDIRRICDSDQCCILLTDNEKCSCRVLGASVKEGSSLLPAMEFSDESFYPIAESWKDTIAGSTCFVAKDEKDMAVLKERNPSWYESLIACRVTSIVLFPLQYGGDTLGYLWAINFDTENSVKITKTLELAAYFLASEIANYILVEKLKVMSSVDLLTGLKNRNAMNTRIAGIENGGCRPTGLIITDINGLKYVNDHNGHNAGDELIKNAAAMLRRISGGIDTEIYRAGGDEFLMIVNDADEQSFNALVDRLKVQDGNVRFAVGGCYFSDKPDIRCAMQTADEQMYIDKERYYQSLPERKR